MKIRGRDIAELAHITEEEFIAWERSVLQQVREEWNRSRRGFPPTAGIDTVAVRIALAELAGYHLPANAAFIMGVSLHALIRAAEEAQHDYVP